MEEIEATLREWGRSIGIVLPKDAAVREKLHAGDTVTILLMKKSRSLKNTFGKLQFKRTTDEILEEIDKEGWHA